MACRAMGADSDTLLSALSEIKLSVTAAVADCIMDVVLGDLTTAQHKLVSCQHLGNGKWDVGCESGYPSFAQAPDTVMVTDLLAGKQDNSHSGWFCSQVILSRCSHCSIKVLSEATTWRGVPG